VLAVRIYRLPAAYEVADSPYIAGCKSWVDLPKPLSTAGAVPVQDDAAFAEQLQRLKAFVSRNG
jgi:hypothetical protein